MSLERGKSYVLKNPERDKYSVVIEVPTPEEIEERKRQLFGAHVDKIHPEIVELIASSVSDEETFSFDEYTLDTIANVSKTVTGEEDMGTALRTIFQAIAITLQENENTVSINGAAENHIRGLEESMLRQQRQETSNGLSADIFRTEIIARQPVELAEFEQSKVVFERLPHQYRQGNAD